MTSPIQIFTTHPFQIICIMKKSIIFLVLVFCNYNIYAQSYGFHEETDFETNTGLVIIDTSSNNNWQIGIPQKTYFDSAYSIPNAIVTNTSDPYTVNNNSSFYISIKDEQWFWGSPSSISFYHKYDSDSLFDGGYIDVSYDGGENWLNIIYDSTMFNCEWTPGFGYSGYNFYGDEDTLFNGKNGFSGKSDEWNYSAFTWYYCIGVKDEVPDSMMIRFNFISDEIQTNKEGWMIDDIVLHSDICGSVKEDISNNMSACVQPNPVNNDSKLILNGFTNGKYDLNIFDINGRLVYSAYISSKEFPLKNARLNKGLFFYQIKFEDNTTLSGKFIKD